MAITRNNAAGDLWSNLEQYKYEFYDIIWHRMNCICKKKKRDRQVVFICAEEYAKCPKKTVDGPMHGYYKTCKLCAGVVEHYHCVQCKKQLPNDNYIIGKNIYYQGACMQLIEAGGNISTEEK